MTNELNTEQAQHEYEHWSDTIVAHEYGQNLRTVMCEICGEEARDTLANLKIRRWDLNGGSEICPRHE